MLATNLLEYARDARQYAYCENSEVYFQLKPRPSGREEFAPDGRWGGPAGALSKELVHELPTIVYLAHCLA